jgi:hypothetical protein
MRTPLAMTWSTTTLGLPFEVIARTSPPRGSTSFAPHTAPSTQLVGAKSHRHRTLSVCSPLPMFPSCALFAPVAEVM